MFHFNVKSTLLNSEYAEGRCDNCGTDRSVFINLYQEYVAYNFIPLLPTRKYGVSECTHCKQVLQKKDFGITLWREYDRMLDNVRAPLWTFSGVGFALLLTVMFTLVAMNEDNRSTKLIQEARAGDLYKIYNSDGYTLYKVESVSGDTVYVLKSRYTTNNKNGIEKIKEDGAMAYDFEEFPYLKSNLQLMLTSGKILDVERR